MDVIFENFDFSHIQTMTIWLVLTYGIVVFAMLVDLIAGVRKAIQLGVARTTLLWALLLLTGCRTHLVASDTTSEKETASVEQQKDSSSQTKVIADSVRWITQTRDSVNVYRMIVVTQDSSGNTIATHDIERTYEWHSVKDSTAAYRKQLEALVSERKELQKELNALKTTSQQTKEKTNYLTTLAAKAFPATAILLAISIILNVGLIKKKL